MTDLQKNKSRITSSLILLAGLSDYQVTPSKFPRGIIAAPHKGKCNCVYGVEATVTNNTIYKSLASLLSFLVKYPNSSAYLVVPQKHGPVALECQDNMTKIIRSFGICPRL